jgi:hypothetical protein
MTDTLRTAPDCFRASETVRASISADGLVLLDVQGGLVLSANSIGARIWELIQQQVGCVEIASRLARDYDVPLERAHRDVVAFVAALEARGLVKPEPPC